MTKNEAIEKAAEVLNEAQNAEIAERMDCLGRIAGLWISLSVQLGQ